MHRGTAAARTFFGCIKTREEKQTKRWACRVRILRNVEDKSWSERESDCSTWCVRIGCLLCSLVLRYPSYHSNMKSRLTERFHVLISVSSPLHERPVFCFMKLLAFLFTGLFREHDSINYKKSVIISSENINTAISRKPFLRAVIKTEWILSAAIKSI